MRLFRSMAQGAALAALCCASFPAHADTDPALEYNRLSRPSDTIATLGDGLFGESVDLYSGGASFDTTDISIPGNNKLPVSLGRHLDAKEADQYGGLPSFANWEADVPYLTGYFSEAGWTATAGGQLDGTTPSQNRCSLDNGGSIAVPPAVFRGGQYFYGQDYWSGNQMYVPGAGTQELLVNGNTAPNISPRPTTGPAAYWITKSLWTISCLPTLQSGGTGEGFLATSPDGTQYYFDTMFSKTVSNTDNFFYYSVDGRTYSTTVHRYKYWIVASKAVDRFGNWVKWNYTGNQLTSITSSDGRTITLSWNADGTIHTASDGTHTWTYGYTAYTPDPSDNQNTTRLTSVALPDNSPQNTDAWSYQYDGNLVQIDTTRWTDPEVKQQEVTCGGPPIPSTRSSGAGFYTLTATHPSGATGVFTFHSLIRGRSYDTHKCTGANPMYPKESEQFALFSKTLSGPGLPTSTWTYSYTPYGSDLYKYNSSWSADCTDNSCPSTVWTNVANPDGSEILSTFGNKFGVTEGQLQDVTVFTDSTHSTVLDDATTTYWWYNSAQPFPRYIGISPQFRANIFLSQEQHPQRTHSEVRDAVTFTSTVNAGTGQGYDAYANPVNTTRSSSLGFTRTDVATFDDNTDLWVLEQPKTLTNSDTNTVVYSKTYDPATALLQNVYSYGLLDASYTFFTTDDSHHQKGLLNTVTDGNSHVTTLSNYYRGVPQSLAFPDSTLKSAMVDDFGHITSLTDPIGATSSDKTSTTTTAFDYDALGRLKTITQPTPDTVAWQPTSIVFAQVNSSEYGLPAGHWKQTETTGNATKITWFDGLWQPVLMQEYDNANPSTTTRFTAKGYDFAGRATFGSYPLASITAFNSTVNGVHTNYDGLGRPTTSTQDSELGVLTTSYAYLPGFQTQVTNPRGYTTTTSYQVFDSPDTSHPTLILSPEGVTTTINRDVFGKPLTVTRSGTGG